MREPIGAELREALDGRVPYVYIVGDALAPRLLREATYEGHRFARVIGEDDAPASVEDELFRADENLIQRASEAPEGAALETVASARAS
jgi:hypothetical protein